MNSKNAQFYDAISVDGLQKIAKLAGLDTCCDVELIKPYLKPNCRILEICAGYGRVVECLLNSGFSNISVVERNQQMIDSLQSKFDDKITIYNKDIFDLQIDQKFDVILWLWGSIADFSQYEQMIAIQKIYAFLEKTGIIAVDTIPTPVDQSELHSFCEDGQNFTFNYNGNKIIVFCPSVEDINFYSKNLDMQHRYFEYVTAVGQKRILHFLTRESCFFRDSNTAFKK